MQWLFYIGVYIPALPAAVAIWYWKRLDVPQRWFAGLLVTVMLLSVSGRIWTVAGFGNNMPFFHTYILLEFLLMMRVFSKMESPILPKYSWNVLSASFLLVWIWNVWLGEGWRSTPAQIHALEALVLLLIAVRWFYLQFTRPARENIANTFEFWLCSGILIYFSANLLLFVYSTHIVQQSSRVFDAIWGVHAALVILLYLIYTLAVLWAAKTRRSS